MNGQCDALMQTSVPRIGERTKLITIIGAEKECKYGNRKM